MTEPSGTQALVAIVCSAFALGLIVGIADSTRGYGFWPAIAWRVWLAAAAIVFVVVGTLALPVYVVGEAWRRRGERGRR